MIIFIPAGFDGIILYKLVYNIIMYKNTNTGAAQNVYLYTYIIRYIIIPVQYYILLVHVYNI